MAIAAGSPILQTDMAALATLATSKLLPLVNAIGSDFATQVEYPNWYDKYVGGYPYAVGDYESPNWISPQPSYAFNTVTFDNLVTSGAAYNGSGQYVYTVATAGDFEILVSDAGFIVAGVTYEFTERAFYVQAGQTITLLGTAGQPVLSAISVARNWLSEYNRIRADMFNLLLNSFTAGNGGLHLNAGAVCSGPWVVGVNDPTTYPITPYSAGDYIGALLPMLQGTLNASYPGSGEFDESSGFNICFAKGVSFICAESDAAGLTVQGQMLIATAASPTNLPGDNDITMAYTVDTDGALTWVLIFDFSWTGSGSPPSTAPAVGGFTLSSPANVAWTTTSPSPGTFYLIATYTKTVSAGDSDSSECKITASPANYGLPASILFYASLNFGTTSSHTIVNALHPTQRGCQFTVPDNGAHSQLVFTATGTTIGTAPTCSAICQYSISNPTVKGIWTATTLPVPGNNVFIDQCMPPFINVTSQSMMFNPTGSGVRAPIAASESIFSGTGIYEPGTTLNPLTTKMTQAAPLNMPGINPVLPGLAAQPSQWLIRRDTDFVPFELGFNENLEYVTHANQQAGGFYTVSVPPNTSSVKIRIVQTGTIPGWRGGGFQYGVPIPQQMQIYVKHSGFATPTSYDFFTTNNSVSIPSDGGPAYIAGLLNNGFTFFIYDPDNTGATFDVYVELDFGNPTRIYFPPIAEVFSYSLDDNPKIAGRFGNSGLHIPVQNNSWSNKPIPQSGYCIFKVRATRLPQLNAAGIALVPATGDEIVITLGQNKLIYGPPSPFTPPGGMGGGSFGGFGGVNNAPGMGGSVGLSSLVFTPFLNSDGSNMTITIPADASSTGDVEVFIVCLAGNEFVWQAAEAVKVEAYANFQPIFFNNLWGQAMFPIDTTYAFNFPFPTVFSYGLAFVNNFLAHVACGYATESYPFSYPDNIIPPFVTYPIDHNIYNDLMTCLNLIS